MEIDKYDRFGKYLHFHHYSEAECHLKYTKILKRHFNGRINGLKMIEVGAGHGNNLLFFKYLGLEWDNIYANEISQERVDILRNNLPSAKVIAGDAATLNFNNYFDIVLQSTVFTSLLDDRRKTIVADKMYEIAKEGGIILWYDFTYNSHVNKKVKGIKRKEIANLFSKAKEINYYNVTLAPPIGRIAGKFYPLINLLFFPLRSHVIAVVHK